MKAALLILAMVAMTGCAEVAGPAEDRALLASVGTVNGVSLTTDFDRYTHGDTIELRLANGAAAEVGYNLCGSWRERETQSGWQRIESLRICTEELRLLQGGGSAVWREPVDPEWGTGRYRIVTNVWIGDARESETLATVPFDVAP